MLKADFHIHSKYSMDCQSEPEAIIKRCQDIGINCIAITDHDAVQGGIETAKMAPFKVIVGEEILTPVGEIMGLFLKERIPSGISPEKAIAAIKEQGGLVNIPHPFDLLRGIRLSGGEMERIAAEIDCIEVFNARCRMAAYNKKALDFAIGHDLPGIGGSDAHSPAEIGNVIVELPEFETPQEFLESLRAAKINGQKSSPFVHFHSTLAKLKKPFQKK